MFPKPQVCGIPVGLVDVRSQETALAGYTAVLRLALRFRVLKCGHRDWLIDYDLSHISLYAARL